MRGIRASQKQGIQQWLDSGYYRIRYLFSFDQFRAVAELDRSPNAHFMSSIFRVMIAIGNGTLDLKHLGMMHPLCDSYE